jgi:arylsulfatase A-like enzyme
MPFENRGRTFTFPYSLPDDSAAAWRAFISTPMIDSLTLALALQGVREMGLGQGPHPDLLAISLSACDYVGHAWGPDSREVHDQQLRMDRYLGAFFDSLAAIRDMRRVVVSFTADHGVTSYPEWSRLHGNPRAGYVELDSIVRRFRQELEVAGSMGRALQWFDLGMLVADRGGLDSAGLDADSVFRGLTRAFRRVPGVARVDTWHTLLAADTARDATARRWRNLAPRDYGAELFVTLRRGMYFDSVGYAMHGQPSDDDAHVPVIFYGPMIRRGTYTRRVSVVDIAPTLARILGIEPLESVQGRALREALR